MNAVKKTICIVAGGEPMIPRYYLRSGLIQALVSHPDIKVVLLAHEAESKLYEKEFAPLGITIAELRPVSPSRFYEWLISASRYTFHPRLSRYAHWYEHYTRDVPLWKMYTKRLSSYIFGSVPYVARVVQGIIRNLVQRVSRHNRIVEFFEEYRPELVFSTSLMNTFFDVPILCEARRRGIKTVASLRGWDAISNLGFMLFHPDVFFVQSEYVKEMACKYNFFPAERVKILGFPHLDWYYHRELIQPREKFLKSLGIAPGKRFILYGAVGSYAHERELEFAKMYDRLVKEGKIPADLILVFRAHPYFTHSLEELDSLSSVIPDRVRSERIPSPGEPEVDRRDIIHQINSLYHCEMLLTVSGTIVLDAVAFGKPVIALAFDGAGKYSYRRSLQRIHDGSCFDWAEVGRCRGMKIVKSPEDMVQAIHGYLEDSAKDREGRECMAQRFIEPFDGKSSLRLSEALLALL